MAIIDENKQIENLVDVLGCSIEEAKEIIQSDRLVDKMGVKEAESDMTADQKAYAKKYRQGNRQIKPKTPPVYNWNTSKKDRPKNLTKIGIIAELFKFINENLTEKAEITNESKIIEFEYEGKQYKLDLIERRKPKN
jgi:hypothetical protein